MVVTVLRKRAFFFSAEILTKCGIFYRNMSEKIIMSMRIVRFYIANIYSFVYFINKCKNYFKLHKRKILRDTDINDGSRQKQVREVYDPGLTRMIQLRNSVGTDLRQQQWPSVYFNIGSLPLGRDK